MSESASGLLMPDGKWLGSKFMNLFGPGAGIGALISGRSKATRISNSMPKARGGGSVAMVGLWYDNLFEWSYLLSIEDFGELE